MTSLKRVAAISAIVFALALLLSLVLAPFALRSSIETYNQLVDKSEVYTDDLYRETTLDLGVSTLRLTDFSYAGRFRVQQSPDEQVHILTLNSGFSYLVPEVIQRDDVALVGFRRLEDIHINEENILRAIAARNVYRNTILQLPPSVSLELEQLDSWIYYHLDLDYDGFANAEALQKQLQDWYRQNQLREESQRLQENQTYLQEQIQDLRLELSDDASCWSQPPEDFAGNYGVNNLYNRIENLRSQLIGEAYDFLGQYSDLSEEALAQSRQRTEALAGSLLAQEQARDLLLARQSYDRFLLELLSDGEELVEPEFAGLDEELLTQQLLDCQAQIQQAELLMGQLSKELSAALRHCLDLWDPFSQEEIPVETPAQPAVSETAPAPESSPSPLSPA